MKDNRVIGIWKSGWLISGVLLVAVCLAGMLAVRDASASNGREKYEVLGTIENIDSAANTITVKLFDGTNKTMQLAKHLTVNGREETRNHAESGLAAQARAVVYYTDKGGEQTAVDVETLNHASRKTVTGTIISADKNNGTLVLRTANGNDQTFRVQTDAIIETGDNVMIFAQFEPQSGAQITLHYVDALGVEAISRVKH